MPIHGQWIQDQFALLCRRPVLYFVFVGTPESKSEQHLCHGQLAELAQLERLQPGQQGMRVALAAVQPVLPLQMPGQMLVQLEHYRHEFPQPVLSG